ncbi:hypothetical protein C7S15_2009 [Burkholderia cepacia]|nr:hypothetical protein [Burkholderia cepacia]
MRGGRAAGAKVAVSCTSLVASKASRQKISQERSQSACDPF